MRAVLVAVVAPHCRRSLGRFGLQADIRRFQSGLFVQGAVQMAAMRTKREFAAFAPMSA